MADAMTRSFQRSADMLLAAVFVAITQGEVWVFSAADDFSIGLRAVASLLLLPAAGSVALRRSRPVLSFWVNTAAVVAVIAAGYPGDFYQWMNLVAIYSVAAHTTSRVAWAALPASLGGVLSYFLRFPDGSSPLIGGFVAATWVAAWLAGRMYGARLEQARLRSERDVARRLADASEERLALEEERSRIARELHDIIGHTVNVMVVHAGAGRRALGRNTDAAHQAFRTIEETGRSALSELDRVLALLRRDKAEQQALATPGLGDLERLAATFTDTGLRVDVKVSGNADDVPASVGLAAYRIVQEALTNTMKHANARSASVQADVADRRLELRIADDGDGDPSKLHRGRGILGMSERAALHGGSVSLDRDGDGGLVVSAELAWEPHA